jgi:hypothetical protein
MKRATPLLLLAVVAGCGSSGGPRVPTIAPAKTFKLVDTQPSGRIEPGRATVAFTVDQPSGRPLTNYRTGAGPHTGVHVIVVKDDLSTIVHRHPPISPNGRISQPIDFPTSGPYHVLADVYPRLSTPGNTNFQLNYDVRVSGAYHPRPLPPFRASQTVDGYQVVMRGKPNLRAIFPTFMKISVTDPRDKPLTFRPWYGALAHAIFFHAGRFAYFHTHVCGPNTPGCTSTLGGARVTGSSTTPGQLRVGVLLPEGGTWRMFLQFQGHGGRVVTVPYTLKVRG